MINDTIADIRYMHEHRLLPNYFFTRKKQFIDVIIKNNNAIFNIIDKLFTEKNIKNIYKKEDYKVEIGKVTDLVTLIKISFPTPEVEPLCYCSYIFYDNNYEKIGYFTIEKGDKASNYLPYVASWNSEGKHENYGNCSFDKNEDLLKCVDIYMKKEFNLKRKK